MPSVDITLGETDFSIRFNLINQSTGAPFDLTTFNTVKLFIKTTDFVTNVVPGGIILVIELPPEDGVVTWNVISSQLDAQPAGQYYGQIELTDIGSGEIRKGRQFDLRLLRSLSS